MVVPDRAGGKMPLSDLLFVANLNQISVKQEVRAAIK